MNKILNIIPYYNKNYKCPICNLKPGDKEYNYFEHLRGCSSLSSVYNDKDFFSYEEVKKREFKVLRSSKFREPKDIKTVKCRNCGSENFIVGKDLFFTAVKCKKCGLESCIHEG